MCSAVVGQMTERKIRLEAQRAEHARLEEATKVENTRLQDALAFAQRTITTLGERFNDIIADQAATIQNLRARLTNLENAHFQNVMGAFIAGAGVAVTIMNLFWFCFKNRPKDD